MTGRDVTGRDVVPAKVLIFVFVFCFDSCLRSR